MHLRFTYTSRSYTISRPAELFGRFVAVKYFALLFRSLLPVSSSPRRDFELYACEPTEAPSSMREDFPGKIVGSFASRDNAAFTCSRSRSTRSGSSVLFSSIPPLFLSKWSLVDDMSLAAGARVASSPLLFWSPLLEASTLVAQMEVSVTMAREGSLPAATEPSSAPPRAWRAQMLKWHLKHISLS